MSISFKNEAFSSAVTSGQETVFSPGPNCRSSFRRTIKIKRRVLLPLRKKKSGSRDVTASVTRHTLTPELARDSTEELNAVPRAPRLTCALAPMCFHFLHTSLKRTPNCCRTTVRGSHIRCWWMFLTTLRILLLQGRASLMTRRLDAKRHFPGAATPSLPVKYPPPRQDQDQQHLVWFISCTNADMTSAQKVVRAAKRINKTSLLSGAEAAPASEGSTSSLLANITTR